MIEFLCCIPVLWGNLTVFVIVWSFLFLRVRKNVQVISNVFENLRNNFEGNLRKLVNFFLDDKWNWLSRKLTIQIEIRWVFKLFFSPKTKIIDENSDLIKNPRFLKNISKKETKYVYSHNKATHCSLKMNQNYNVYKFP